MLSLSFLLIFSTRTYPSPLSLCLVLREAFLDSSEQGKSAFIGSPSTVHLSLARLQFYSCLYNFIVSVSSYFVSSIRT